MRTTLAGTPLMTHPARLVTAILATLSFLILSLTSLCAWAVAHGASMRWKAPFRLLCHGMPERCFELFGEPMPLCARCSGIYAGVLAGVLLFLAVAFLRRSPFSAAVAILCVAPLVIDGVTQALGFRESTNGLRLFTGILAGMVASLWLLTRLEEATRRIPAESR